MKRLVKQIIASPLYHSGLLRLLDRPGEGEADFKILTYHRVLPVDDPQRKYTQPGLVVSPGVFDRQLAFLRQHYHVISLSGLVGLLHDNKDVPSRTAVITFDDGWRDNYVHAMPILKEHNLPATVFLTTDFVDSERMLWFLRAAVIHHHVNMTPDLIAAIASTVDSVSEVDLGEALADRDDFMEYLKDLHPDLTDRLLDQFERAAGLNCDMLVDRPCMVNWDEVKEMQACGIEMGSHGRSHRIMTRLNADELRQELSVSREEIEEKTGKEITLLAYPNGNCNDLTRELAREAGYHCALSTGSLAGGATQDLFAMPRIGVHEGMSVDGSGMFSPSLFAFVLSRFASKISRR